MKSFKLMLVAVIAVFTMALVSCDSTSSKIDKFLDDYENLADQIVTATKDGDVAKAAELQKQAVDLQKDYSDIKESDFSEAQKARFLKIQAEIADKALKGAMQNAGSTPNVNVSGYDFD